ncbi:MAG: hypothetical protein U5L96_05000 [Owenweeksia sp.]|nr:hypothetical protein [Owenweeksia sp.]
MRKYILSALALSALLYSGCKEEDNTPEPVNEEELITTVRLSFIPQGGGSTAVFQFVDLDGDGGSDPVITNDTLQDSTNYTLSIEFLNESVNPAEDITAEVVEEGTETPDFLPTICRS